MKYYELEPEENTFESIVVDLTHRCNMECANCYIPNRNIPDLSAEKLYQFLSRLPKRTYIRLIGAEPTMREDLADIIRTVLKMKHKPSLTTNGLKFGRPEYAKEMRDAGLRMLLLSMNGADDNDVYKIIDCGKYATLKMRAIENSFKNNFMLNTGTIIAKNVNEHTIERQIEIVSDLQHKYNLRVKPVVRMKSIGSLGRHMENCTYEFDELVQLFSDTLKLPKDYIMQTACETGVNRLQLKDDGNSYVFEYKNILVRLINWEQDDDGVVDAGSENRGRLTEDFKIAPFFEHVKKNEFEY